MFLYGILFLFLPLLFVISSGHPPVHLLSDIFPLSPLFPFALSAGSSFRGSFPPPSFPHNPPFFHLGGKNVV